MTDKFESSEKRNIIISRLKLLVVLSLFIGPLMAAFIWYYGFGGNKAPIAQSNHAPLIQPIIPLQPFTNQSHDGEAVDFQKLKKIWTLVHLVGEECNQDCEKSLYNTRQMRIAVGKNLSRIQRIIFVKNKNLVQQVQQNHPDALILKTDSEGLYLQVESIVTKGGIGTNDAVIIDPLGNAMMYVPVELDPRLLLKDLKKLLKLSHIG